MQMTEEEKKEAVAVAESIGPVQIAETLEDLIAREKTLLDATEDPEMRAIVLHNVAILTAACAGYQESARNFEAAAKAVLAETEEGREGKESG